MSIMPYNTRRKSLSLPSLGIHVPVTHAARAAAAAANRALTSPSTSSSARASSRANSPVSMASPASLSRDTPPPSKKLKRAHSDDPDGNAQSSEPSPKRRDDAKVKFENTPPPSPRSARQSVEMDDVDAPSSKAIDMGSINDEIVEAVIVQLQSTANRPHLVKELVPLLMQQLKIVQQSANPAAIISSRLASYLKRPWTAKSPCPLAKELESVHPRRTYFYLTTCPHLPLPDPAQAAALSHLTHSRTIISPSLSSASSGSDEAEMDRRRELSPSPEVDLSSPEFDDMDDEVAMPTTPIGSLSLRGFRSQMNRIPHNGRPWRRGVSPPLEKDEKEFTQTADGLQKRKLKGDLLATMTSPVANADLDYCAKDDNGLFGERMLMPGLQPIPFVTSPAIRPSAMSLNFTKRDTEAENWLKLDGFLEWDRSPESIELEELDGLLNDY